LTKVAAFALVLLATGCTLASDYGKYTFDLVDAGTDAGTDAADSSIDVAVDSVAPTDSNTDAADSTTPCDCDCDDRCEGGECVPSNPAKDVRAGGRHACAWTVGDELFCWGDNDEGQLGLGDADRTLRPAPVFVDTVGAITDLAIGAEHTCLIADGFQLSCWGSNSWGVLGVGSGIVDSTGDPQEVDPTRRWTVVTAGDLHTCAITDSMAVYCWGRGINGRLGLGSTTSFSRPQSLREDRYSSLTAGLAHTCGIQAGVGRCWGQANNGRLGTGNTMDFDVPTDMATPPDLWGAITAGARHTCGIDSVGTGLYCWGDSTNGQLGVGPSSDLNRPTRVGTTADWTDVAAGAGHTCAVRDDDEVWCFGSNATGELGIGDNSPRDEPVRVTSPADRWTEVSAGDGLTCAIRSGGQVWCWGSNTFGQLGVGDNADRNLPARVCLP